ncbi:MAG: hypothetical protein LUE24_11680, partial [Lachnospiraceae bacterium]|nr:hypothetical protein [Lachnospiraceae bacterium]
MLIWDALGLTEAGLTGNGAIIKDAAVADDAAISGYKLDIASVAEYLTTDGSLQVDAAQVIINESTLVAEYVTITTATNEAALAAEAAQALADALASEAVTSITQYYALGDSADEPPCDPADGAERAAATVETAVVGESLVEVTETSSTWTTAYQAPADGEYLWTAFYVVYYDGNAEWTEPTCLTDGVAREKTTTLETELEVVQGQISSKVWQTDIDTAVDTLEGEITTIQDQYTTVTETIEGITTEIGDLTTTVNGDGTTTGLVSRVTTLETTAEGITATVTSVQSQIDNLSIGGRNYALNSGRYTEGDDPAWYLSSTTAEDYFTISVADGYTRIYRDITQSMMCYVWLDLSDAFDSAAEYMVSLRVRLSKAAALALRAYHSSSTNVSISSFDAANFTAGEWVTRSCAFTPDSSYTYQRVGFSLSNFATAGDYIDIAWIKVEQGTVATDWTPAPEDTETIVTSVVSASLALTIETDDDGVAYGCISANAAYILFEAGQLIINAGNFTMDEDGNIVANNGTFTGTIYASGGTVGGWNITSTRIKSSSSIYVGAAEAGMLLMNESDRPYIHVQDSNTNTTFQVARDGAVKSSNLTITGGSITLGGVFSVTSAGMLYAKGGAEFDGNLEMYS